jgi:hypothetical protein
VEFLAMAAAENPASGLPIAIRTAVIACLVVLADVAALHLDFRQPFVGYGIGGACLLLLAARPSWRQVVIVVVAAAMIAFFVVRRIEDAATLIIQLTGSLGLATLLYLCCKVVWEPWEACSATLRILLPSSVLTFMIFGSVYSLNMASYLHAKTFDLYTFVFDGSLGFQPSFLCGRALAANSWLIPLVRLTYEGIVLAMAAFYAAFMARRQKPIWELIELLFAAAMVGYLFFSVFPVCGPRYGFPASFPGAYFPYARLEGLTLQRIPVDWLIPRNGVPSLHFTWALLIWWNIRSLPRWGRVTATAFVLATAFDTMATGEHYLFDLIAALPFALCMQASMVRTVAFRNRERWLPVLCGGAMFLGWLALCRFGLPLLLQSPFLPWSLALASSVVSIAWAFRLPALIPEMQARGASLAKVKAVAATA